MHRRQLIASLLLEGMNHSFGFTKRFASCFIDTRNEKFVEHPLLTMIRQRTYGIALGYEDLNDHVSVKSDPLMASLCGHSDVEGRRRRKEKDKGNPLAGKSTLNRLELPCKKDSDLRCKKIVPEPEKLEIFSSASMCARWIRRLGRWCWIWTIRTKLFKIGAVVKTSTRRVLVSLSAHHPMIGLFMEVAGKLQRAGPRA